MKPTSNCHGWGLYLSDHEYPKEMLDSHKAQQEKIKRELTRERDDLAAHLKGVILSDADIAHVEQFCKDVQEGLDAATVEDKRRYFDLLDIQTRVTLEGDQKVVYVRCKIGEQQLVHSATSRLLSIGVI